MAEFMAKKELQSITRSNQQGNEATIKPWETTIYTDQCEEEIPSVSSRSRVSHYRVSSGCLIGGLMASSSSMEMVEAGKQGGPASAARDEAFRQRAGKQAVAEKANGKNIIVVDMAGARQAMRARFLAVGLFLSVLLANSQQVIEHMKKVWKIRGEMEANQIAAALGQRRFILEFSKKGDRDHVVRGGPWQYKGDAFLAEGLEVGDDPDTALFTHLPVWVQFRNIPFYLLTKKLARDLGDQVGTLLMIDEHSRGNICEKFLRARVKLPLYLALQKTITLKDEITEEEVEVHLRQVTITSTTAVVTHVLNTGASELGGKGNINTKEANEETVPPCIITGDTVTENAIANVVVQVLDNNNEPVPTADQMANVAVHAPDINTEQAPVVDQVGVVAATASDGEGSNSASTNMKNKSSKTWKRNGREKGNDKADSSGELPPLMMVYVSPRSKGSIKRACHEE
ncbi:hypothetical protein ACQ4PT_042868 [Festuca glaucescens]